MHACRGDVGDEREAHSPRPDVDDLDGTVDEATTDGNRDFASLVRLGITASSTSATTAKRLRSGATFA